MSLGVTEPGRSIAVGVLLATWVAVAQQGRPVNDAVLRTAPTTGEEWLTYGLDLGEKRFSPLNQINATNVSRLGLAWSYDIPGTFGNPPGGGNQEATPLVWNGTLYGITTWSVVFAVDARTGKATLDVGSAGEPPRRAAQDLLRHRQPRRRDLRGQDHRADHRRTPGRARRR